MSVAGITTTRKVANIHENSYCVHTLQRLYLWRVDSSLRSYILLQNVPVNYSNLCVTGDTIFFLGIAKHSIRTLIGHMH